MNICPVEAELFHEDRRTDKTKVIVALRNFLNAPKTNNSSKKPTIALTKTTIALTKPTIALTKPTIALTKPTIALTKPTIALT
jgi:hypothetical protein